MSWLKDIKMANKEKYEEIARKALENSALAYDLSQKTIYWPFPYDGGITKIDFLNWKKSEEDWHNYCNRVIQEKIAERKKRHMELIEVFSHEVVADTCVNDYFRKKFEEEIENLIFGRPIRDFSRDKKEDLAMNIMKVSYNGFTGELVKLERKESYAGNTFCYDGTTCKSIFYDLSIYDSEKKVMHSFNGVKFSDIRFLGGVVSFGG